MNVQAAVSTVNDSTWIAMAHDMMVVNLYSRITLLQRK